MSDPCFVAGSEIEIEIVNVRYQRVCDTCI